MSLIRKILLPFVPFYYLVTWWRNVFYDTEVFSSKSYDFPVICVGNLSVGGTGKTPMIEYLIRLLRGRRIATLSRGYKRKTKGFVLASGNMTASDIGDEPFQFYNKFKDVLVSVDESRQNGISNLMKLEEASPEVILLDDAYQHRKVKAGLNILLTLYDNRYSKDICLPTGNLREPRNGANRAHIVVVTKCPHDLDVNEKTNIQKELNLGDDQELFFSTIKYADSIYSVSEENPISFLSNKDITLVTGIANPKPLLDYLNDKGLTYEHLNFKDHHDFTEKEVELLNSKSFVLTTEKDFMRLKDKVNNQNLYYLPIEVTIDRGESFNKLILDFTANN